MESAVAHHEEEAAGDHLVAVGPAFARRQARDRAGVLSRWLATVDAAAGATAGTVVGVTGGLGATGAVLLAISVALGWTATAFTLGLYANDDLRSWVSGVSEVPRGLVGALLFSWPLFGALYAWSASPTGPLTVYGVVLTVLLSAVGRAAVRARLHRLEPLRQRAAI